MIVGRDDEGEGQMAGNSDWAAGPLVVEVMLIDLSVGMDVCSAVVSSTWLSSGPEGPKSLSNVPGSVVDWGPGSGFAWTAMSGV
jgi:hypothetical protein